MKYRCPRSGCGREFGSARALAIHMAKTHGERKLHSKRPKTPKGRTGPPELKQALKALGIAPQKVLSFKIYDDRVVIIEGPGGKKRVWQKPKEEVVRSGK